jgi:hypothetical protein
MPAVSSVQISVTVLLCGSGIDRREEMGSGASQNNALNTEEYFSLTPPEFALDDLTWIKISHSYETHDSFSSVSVPFLLNIHLI